jgi:GT2 family glycosyltransferase
VKDDPFGISVVIPNYNGENIISETIYCAIEALETSELNNYEIIVSDDASYDNSVSVIKDLSKEIIIIQSETNTGFSSNVNRGVKAATKELVFILNSDLHLGKGYFKSILPLFENKNVFGVMGLIKTPVTLEFQDGAKVPIINYHMYIKSNKNDYSKPGVSPTFFLSGANALIRREYFLLLDGFCELFNPYYSEDVDLGIRAWKMGWELYFQPNAICYHEISATINKLPKNKVRIIAKRNTYILHGLHLPKFTLIIYNLNLVVITLFRFLKGDLNYLIAFKKYLKLQKLIRKERIKFINLNEKQRKLNLFQVIKKIKSLDLN